MSIIWDVKSIRRKLERQEQKAEFEEKNPPVDPNKVVWSPEWGYGMAAPYSGWSVELSPGDWLAV